MITREYTTGAERQQIIEEMSGYVLVEDHINIDGSGSLKYQENAVDTATLEARIAELEKKLLDITTASAISKT